MLERSEGLSDGTEYNMSLAVHPISQPRVALSPMWTPVIEANTAYLLTPHEDPFASSWALCI
jgi:hypothetical protein